MKKHISYVAILTILLFILTSCGNKSVDETEQSLENETFNNVVIDDSSSVKPHTTQLYNDIFSIKIDDSFDGKYDTVVENNYIEVYDKESEDNGYPGLVFAICAFENPEDWAGGPHEKIGELKLNSGKVYDIIIGYPTESQTGFGTTMPDNYQHLFDERYNIGKSLTGSNGEKIDISSGTVGDKLYDAVIKKHIKAVDEGWDSTKLEEENMSPMYNVIRVSNDNYKDVIKYAYCDVNLDGIEELLIGEVNEYDKHFVIYDLYTMVNRNATHVFSGWDRNRYYALKNGFISNEYSNGANESGVNIYALGTNSTNLIYQLGFKYDGYEDEKNPWFISYDDTNGEYDWVATTEEQYNELMKRFSEYEELSYHELLKYPN